MNKKENKAFKELIEKFTIAWLEFELNWKHQVEEDA